MGLTYLILDRVSLCAQLPPASGLLSRVLSLLLEYSADVYIYITVYNYADTSQLQNAQSGERAPRPPCNWFFLHAILMAFFCTVSDFSKLLASGNHARENLSLSSDSSQPRMCGLRGRHPGRKPLVLCGGSMLEKAACCV